MKITRKQQCDASDTLRNAIEQVTDKRKREALHLPFSAFIYNLNTTLRP